MSSSCVFLAVQIFPVLGCSRSCSADGFAADKLELFCCERNEKHYNMADKPVCFFTYPNLSRAWLALEAVWLIVFAGRLIRSQATRHASEEGVHRGRNGPRVHTIFSPPTRGCL
jgi:hypothetical protein